MEDRYWRFGEDRLYGPDVGKGPAFEKIAELQSANEKLQLRIAVLQGEVKNLEKAYDSLARTLEHTKELLRQAYRVIEAQE